MLNIVVKLNLVKLSAKKRAGHAVTGLYVAFLALLNLWRGVRPIPCSTSDLPQYPGT